LVEYYKKHSADKKFEVVFVSSDRDQKAFDEYFGEMPWLALPYENRELKNKLSQKFKVQGIPTLAVLDPAGNLITDKGRAKVSEDPDCSAFPWAPKPLAEVLEGVTLVNKAGEKTAFSDLQTEGSVIGLYFSAHWCPPCRGFTPELVKTYNKLKAEGKKFEIVFVSSDRDEAAFKEYLDEMPWLALPYEDRSKKAELSDAFDVEGIPSFVILDANLKTIQKDGRSAVGGDKDGAEFPWYPKPLNDFAGGPGQVNDLPSLVAFCDVEEEQQKKVVAAMEKVSRGHWDEQEQKGEEPAFAFFTAKTADGIGARVRQLCKVDSGAVKVVMLDIPAGGKYYTSDITDVTPETLKGFLTSYSEQTPSSFSG
jgi:nucleoredoxin